MDTTTAKKIQAGCVIVILGQLLVLGATLYDVGYDAGYEVCQKSLSTYEDTEKVSVLESLIGTWKGGN